MARRRRSESEILAARAAASARLSLERVDDLEAEGVAGPEGPEGPQGPSGNVELGYAETTAAASTSTTLFSNVADNSGDVAGLTTTVTVGERPIEIEFWAQRVYGSSATASTIVAILENDTVVGLGRIDQGATVSEGGPVAVKRRLTPSAGEHTYKVVLASIGAATTTIVASADAPAYISVTEK